MTRWRLALLVSLLILTAGTLTIAEPLESAQANPAIQPAPDTANDRSVLKQAPQGIEPQHTSTQSAVERSIETGAETSSKQSSPWNRTKLVVAIDRPVDHEVNTTELVADALEYWNNRGREHAKYPAEFTLKPGVEDPDILIRFESQIDCTTAQWELGCAPVLTSNSTPEPPEIVRIEAGYTNETTRRVLKHEFGHILGIRHGESPQSLMQPRYAATTRQQLPNASERLNPWGRTTLTVYIDQERLPPWSTERYYDQIRHALAYYQNGADGVAPRSLTFRFVDQRSDANIVISYWPQGSCEGVMVGSCATSAGVDLDRDASREYLTQIRIALAGVNPRAVGWHVGYWTGLSLKPAGAPALPQPFQMTDPADRTSRWWTNETRSDADQASDPTDTTGTPDSRLGQSIGAAQRTVVVVRSR
ncbi:MAG: matrixin family metalloprotease [Halobacteriales archaeon]